MDGPGPKPCDPIVYRQGKRKKRRVLLKDSHLNEGLGDKSRDVEAQGPGNLGDWKRGKSSLYIGCADIGIVELRGVLGKVTPSKAFEV